MNDWRVRIGHRAGFALLETQPPFHRLFRLTAGFTQIEVLTAMLIIGVATPFLMGAVIGGLTQARHWMLS